MTPKEQAEKLVSKYLRTYPIYNNPTVVISYTHHEAKQCALITVNEIIKILSAADDFMFDEEIKYYYEVEQEIENL